MKILIVGGGIAGMASAALLHRQGHDVLIIENALEYRHIGFGLYIWNFGRKVLDELGIGDSLLNKGYLVPGADLQNVRYKTLCYVSYGSRVKYRPISIYRADLHQSLRDAAAGVPVRFGTTFTSLEQDDTKVTVQFNDGTADRFDMVIGADGIQSRVRKIVLDNPELLPYGWRAYALWGDSWKRKTENVQLISAPGCGLAIIPLHDRHFAGFTIVCLPDEPDPVETRRKRLHEYAHAFDQDVHDLIDSVNPADIFRTDLMYVPRGPWARGRVVLIGDARHAMSPISGRGANIALEDASVLANMMKHARPHNIPEILQRFGAERSVRVDRLRSHFYNKLERLMLIRGPIIHAVRNLALRLLPDSLLNGKPDPSFD